MPGVALLATVAAASVLFGILFWRLPRHGDGLLRGLFPAAGVLVLWLDGGLTSAWLACLVPSARRVATPALRFRGDAWLRTCVAASHRPDPHPLLETVDALRPR